MDEQVVRTPEETRIFDVLVEDMPGVLARVIGHISSRGFNITSLVVGATQENGVSHITMVFRGTESVFEQIRTQIEKLVDAIAVEDITNKPHVERELVLIKVQATPTERGEILQIVQIFRAHTVDVTPQSITLEIIGGEEKIGAFVKMLQPYGILQIVRTGLLAILRGDNHFVIPSRGEHVYETPKDDPLGR